MIEEGGRFTKACPVFLESRGSILYQDLAGEGDVTREKKAASKTKFICPACELNAWAMPEANLTSTDCGEEMEPGRVMRERFKKDKSFGHP